MHLAVETQALNVKAASVTPNILSPLGNSLRFRDLNTDCVFLNYKALAHMPLQDLLSRHVFATLFCVLHGIQLPFSKCVPSNATVILVLSGRSSIALVYRVERWLLNTRGAVTSLGVPIGRDVITCQRRSGAVSELSIHCCLCVPGL